MEEAIRAAVSVFLDPGRLGLLMVGVLSGIVIGILPGMGSLVAVSVLLPFAYKLDPVAALALLTGAAAVTHTSDTISAVLIGAPGSASATPTTIEGYPLAKKGQAARVLSAAYLASLIGGLIGALGLTLSIPIARPLVLSFGSPELFMLCALGISFAGALLGKEIRKGLAAGLLGVLAGTIGPAPAVAVYRYSFGHPYLMDNISIVLVALGLFALPEVVSLLVRGGAIARRIDLGTGWLQGARDVVRHMGLLLRGALVGVWAGILPALGATAGTLMAYGQAIATSKDKSRFGKGDIRGVIAPEAANNAVLAGDLVPTLLFSVPGSATAAVMMAALLRHGIFPGPRFLTEHLSLLYVIIWSYAFANLIGAGICFAMSPAMARLTFLPFAVMAPAVILTLTLGAYQTSQDFGDLTTLFLLGLFGWAMKRSGWPRGPFLIGFVLSGPLERYFYLTVNLYPNLSWLTRPGVIIIGLMLLAPILGPIFRGFWKKEASKEGTMEAIVERKPWQFDISTVTSAGMVVIFGLAVAVGARFAPSARLVPWLAAIPGLALAASELLQALRGRAAAVADEEAADEEEAGSDPDERRKGLRKSLVAFLGVGVYFLLMLVVGFRVATAVSMMVFLLAIPRMRPIRAIAYTAATLVIVETFGLKVLGIKLPMGMLWP